MDVKSFTLGYKAGASKGGGNVSQAELEAAIKAVVPGWALAEKPPEDAVTSVNGQVGAVNLPIPSEAADVGADPVGTAEAKLKTHNTDNAAHEYIQQRIDALRTLVENFMDIDDESFDQLSEILRDIRANTSALELLGTNKVDKTAISTSMTDSNPEHVASMTLIVALDNALTVAEQAIEDLKTNKQTAAQVAAAINNALSGYLTVTDGDERYEKIKQKLEEMDSEEELYERGDVEKQYIVGGYVYEYDPDEVWTQFTEFNTGLANLVPPVRSIAQEDNSELVYKSGVLTSGLIPFSRGWDASGEAIRALSKVVIGTKDSAIISEVKPTSMGALTTPIGAFHYNTDGMHIGFTRASALSSLRDSNGAAYSDSATIPLPEDFLLKDSNTNGVASWSSVGYVRVVIGIGEGMTDDEVANLAKHITITVPETYKEARTGKWVNTGEKAYDDEAIQEVAEEVAALEVRVTATEGAIAQINEALGGEVTTVANYRSIAFVGDSITYGTGASNYGTLKAGWVGEVMTRCGYDEDTSVNLGVSGAGFVHIAPAPSSVTIVDIVNAQSFAAFDDIIVSAGINDWKSTTIALADFWANLKAVFVKLRSDNKYARIYCQLPYNCKISSWTGSTYDTHYALDYKEGGSGNYCIQYTLATFRQMIADKINTDEDIKTLGIRIIDYMPLTRNNIDQITGDGLHPNAVGYKIIGKTIAQILNLS